MSVIISLSSILSRRFRLELEALNLCLQLLYYPGYRWFDEPALRPHLEIESTHLYLEKVKVHLLFQMKTVNLAYRSIKLNSIRLNSIEGNSVRFSVFSVCNRQMQFGRIRLHAITVHWPRGHPIRRWSGGMQPPRRSFRPIPTATAAASIRPQSEPGRQKCPPLPVTISRSIFAPSR